jgi:hypothetical protein
MSVPRVSLPLLAVVCLIPACKKPTVEAYRVPKETPPASAETAAAAPMGGAAPGMPAAPAAGGAGNMANTAVATADGPGLAWTAPATWTAKPGSAMRKGSYTIKAEGVPGEGDLSITAFPGDVGGELANVNRWRGQVQAAPITQAELATATQHIDANGMHITVVDAAGSGAGASRVLGAIVPHNGSTWFFKLMGPDALVAREKPVFLKFLETIKPAAGTP